MKVVGEGDMDRKILENKELSDVVCKRCYKNWYWRGNNCNTIVSRM